MKSSMIPAGHRVGMLTVVQMEGFVRDGAKGVKRYMALAVCDCGNETRVRGNGLLSGNVKSCGCLVSKPTHGLTNHRLYPCWLSMVRRCSDPACKSFPHYGGRGISVCARWAAPGPFISDMGPTYVEGLSIERTDVNGNYEPGNCRWATNDEQQRNRRNNHLLEVNGETKTLSEWAREVGLDRASILARLAKGWSVEAALTEPRRDRYGNLR